MWSHHGLATLIILTGNGKRRRNPPHLSLSCVLPCSFCFIPVVLLPSPRPDRAMAANFHFRVKKKDFSTYHGTKLVPLDF